MKPFLNTLLYLIVLISFDNSAYSLSESQINQICQKKPRRSNCKKYLKSRKLDLLQGNRIEIPVIPFKK